MEVQESIRRLQAVASASRALAEAIGALDPDVFWMFCADFDEPALPWDDLRALREKNQPPAKFNIAGRKENAEKYPSKAETEAWRAAFAASLGKLDLCAGEIEAAERLDFLEPTADNRGRGRPQSRVASRTADVTSLVFMDITGRNATLRVNPATNKPYGPFFDLLSGVFKILGIKASAAAQARQVSRRRLKEENIDV